LVSDASAEGDLLLAWSTAGHDVDDVAAALGDHLPDGPLGDLEESGQVGGADGARGRYDGAPGTTERGGQAGADAEAPVMTAAFIEAPAS
jgi:hypothetical protein